MEWVRLGAALYDAVTRDSFSVPAYPAVALELQRLIDSGNYDVDKLAVVVRADQALSAALLRSANSAFHAASAPVTGLRAAIARLGSRDVLRVALATCLGAGALRPGPLMTLRRLIWQHAVGSALVCRHLSAGDPVAMDEAYLCGLLHDFGRIIALCALEDLLPQFPSVAPKSAEQWERLIDEHHVPLGVAVARRWSLPPFLTQVIAAHHDPSKSTPNAAPLVDLVRTADDVCHLMFSQPTVTAEDLLAVKGLRTQEERAAVLELLPQVPALIASFCAPGRAVTPAGKAALANRVTAPAALLTKDAAALTQGVNLTWQGLPRSYTTTRVGPQGLMMAGPSSLPEHQLVSLDVTQGTSGVSLWAQVWRCQQDSAQHVLEMRLLGTSPAQWQTWQAMLAGAAAG